SGSSGVPHPSKLPAEAARLTPPTPTLDADRLPSSPVGPPARQLPAAHSPPQRLGGGHGSIALSVRSPVHERSRSRGLPLQVIGMPLPAVATWLGVNQTAGAAPAWPVARDFPGTAPPQAGQSPAC
ncbi:MAG: hypothetical protein ACKOGA_23820, partial [Planctomycetaceae bacterium]